MNNLIGELDSFQREHELKEKSRKQNGGFLENPFNRFVSMPIVNCDFDSTSTLNGNMNGNTGSLDTDNSSDKVSIGSLNYSTQSTGNVSGSNDVKFTYSDSEISRYVSEYISISGFENP